VAGEDDEQYICHRRQPNSLATPGDSEELCPSFSYLGRTSLSMMQTGAGEHGEAKAARGSDILRERAWLRAATRSSSPYPDLAGGSNDTSIASG
jgi:hypothetical protein